MKIFIYLLAIFGATSALIEPFGTDVCRLFGNGVILREPGAPCSNYIECQNGVTSKKSSCTGTKPYYSRNDKKCTAGKTIDTFCDDPCKKSSPTWVADPITCNGYYKCVNGTGKLGYCRSDLHFDESQQACIYISESSCEGYNICDIAPDGVPIKNENNCQEYFQCLKGKLETYICENGYYDLNRGCVDRSEVECAIHPIPYQICGTNKKPIWNKFVSDKISCRGYYYCRDMGEHEPDLQPSWGKCPDNRFFSFEFQACYTPYATVCDQDRCEGRNREKVLSSTKGCQHYLICENNVKISEEQCPTGLYFDDITGECVDEIKNYDACS